MKADQSLDGRRPTDPLFQGADAALRRAAIKAKERRAQIEQALVKKQDELEHGRGQKDTGHC